MDAVTQYASIAADKYGIFEGHEAYDAGYDAVVDAVLASHAHPVSVGVFALRRWLDRQREPLGRAEAHIHPGFEDVDTAEFLSSLTPEERAVLGEVKHRNGQYYLLRQQVLEKLKEVL